MTDYDYLYVEQAEYIDDNSFQKWNIEHPDEKLIINKLSQGGAKLIVGPRGCGKTTLMLKAYNKLCSSRNSKTFAIYVNFKSSLKLEPFYKKDSKAVIWFNQWLLFKVYKGLYDTLDRMRVKEPIILTFTLDFVDNAINKLELGSVDIFQGNDLLSLSVLEKDILKLLDLFKKKRCVLLLDDAAHAFSSEQQRDFFDFFRSIKSRVISPKAAIYPGVTNYSSAFHVGHDAEEIDVWIKPDSSGYIDFMLNLLEKRLPNDVYTTLNNDKELLKLICYASFGMPRALLNMIREFEKTDSTNKKKETDIDFKRKKGMKVITINVDQTMKVYTSLKVKLPMYEHFIDTGDIIFSKMIEHLKEYNRGKAAEFQIVTIAIEKPLPAEISKVLGFLQYSGLLLPKGDISKGEKGTFERYVVHYAALINKNALFGQKGVSINNFVEVFDKKKTHDYTRITPNRLVAQEDIKTKFSLSLPPCQVCNTPRLSENSKFCSNCGAALKTVSVFESLVATDIEKLPLTYKRVESIKSHSRIRTVKDILMDTDKRELRGVPGVGPAWAKKIASYAEEFIS